MYHKIIVAGYVGQRPTMRYTPNGNPVTNFSVAANERWTGQDGEKNERTVWFRISAWNRLAEVVNEYLDKGRPVLVEGTLRSSDSGGPRLFTRSDGSTGASFEVTAQRVVFVGGRDETQEAVDDVPAETDDESIPF